MDTENQSVHRGPRTPGTLKGDSFGVTFLGSLPSQFQTQTGGPDTFSATQRCSQNPKEGNSCRTSGSQRRTEPHSRGSGRQWWWLRPRVQLFTFPSGDIMGGGRLPAAAHQIRFEAPQKRGGWEGRGLASLGARVGVGRRPARQEVIKNWPRQKARAAESPVAPTGT